MYAAPRGATQLGEHAARWLGRHIDPLPAPAPAEIERVESGRLWELTREPRLYGFHGTLKPPFHLAPSSDVDAVHATVAGLAAVRAPVAVGRLRVDVVDRFVALVPDDPPDALADLAAACVTELDPHRRPADELELTRRRRAGLSERQGELLLAWGYPYVLDEFRFHLTLTRRLEAGEADDVLAAARTWFEPVESEPYVIDELCVVEQPAPGEPFVVTARHPLG